MMAASIEDRGNIFLSDLKLRAWDGNRMIYLSDISIGLDKNAKPYVYFNKDTFEDTVLFGNHQLMLCAPWPDKNGNDVYAGDVIENSYKDEMEDSGEAVVRVVIGFKNGAFGWFGELTESWHYLQKSDLSDAVVVGNIVENPDLLEGY